MESVPRVPRVARRTFAVLALAASVVLHGGGTAQAQPDWMAARMLGGRTGHVMAYDFARERLVLFGGEENITRGRVCADTWEWDGSNWALNSPTTGPGLRYRHAMAYDLVRQRVVVCGGEFPSGSALADTWEWDGGRWKRLSPVTIPDTCADDAMAYDVARKRLVLLGCSGTWLFGSLTRATAQPIGSACPGSNGPPVLTSDDPWLGNPAFRLELFAARASAPCLFGLSAGTQSQPIGPCTLYLAGPAILVFAQSNAAGCAETTRFALPHDIALRGTSLYAQAFVVDSQGAGPGLAFSAGRRLVLGD